MDLKKFITRAFRKNDQGALPGVRITTPNVISIVKKTEKPKIIKSTKLSIVFVDGSNVEYSASPVNVTDPTEFWKEFYDWYMLATTENYIMPYTNTDHYGIKMMRRVDIRSFNCDIIEETSK